MVELYDQFYESGLSWEEFQATMQPPEVPELISPEEPVVSEPIPEVPEEPVVTPEREELITPEAPTVPEPVAPTDRYDQFVASGKSYEDFQKAETKAKTYIGAWEETGKEPTKKYGFFDKLKEMTDEPSDILDLIPFVAGGKEVVEIGKVAASAYRLDDGTATEEDVTRLQEFLQEANKDTTFGYKVLDVVSQMPAFMGEFIATLGFYAAGRKVATKAATKVVKKYLGKQGAILLEKRAAALGLKVVAGVVGATYQAPIMGAPRIVAGTVERMMPELGLSEDEKGELAVVIEGPGEDLLPALAKSFGDQWAETVSEHSGGLFGELGAIAKKAALDQALKSGLLSSFIKANPTKSVSEITKLFRKVGYHGVINEMAEERVGEVLRAGIGVTEGYELPTREQLLVELVSFAVPGVVMKATERVAKKPGEPTPTAEARLEELEGKRGFIPEEEYFLQKEEIQKELTAAPPSIDVMRTKFETGRITEEHLEAAKKLWPDNADFIAGIDAIIKAKEAPMEKMLRIEREEEVARRKAEAEEAVPPVKEPWREDAYAKADKVDEVPIAWIKKFREYKGDELRDRKGTPEYEELKKSIEEEGLKEPLMLTIGKQEGKALLDEGNHRLAIMEELGYEKVPVRVQRFQKIGKRGVKVDMIPKGEEYWPADSKPSEVFPELKAEKPVPVMSAYDKAQLAKREIIEKPRGAVRAEPVVEPKPSKTIEKWIKREMAEVEGQKVLDEMEETKRTPSQVAKEFWSKTYFKLEGADQEKFQRQVKAITGHEPGSALWIDPKTGDVGLAKDWIEVGEDSAEALPSKVEHLEGTARGYVALMEYMNRREAPKPTKKPVAKIAPPKPKPVKKAVPPPPPIEVPGEPVPLIPEDIPAQIKAAPPAAVEIGEEVEAFEPEKVVSYGVNEAVKRGLISKDEAAVINGLMAGFPDHWKKHFEPRISAQRFAPTEAQFAAHKIPKTERRGKIITGALIPERIGDLKEDAKHVAVMFEGSDVTTFMHEFGEFAHERLITKKDVTNVVNPEYRKAREAGKTKKARNEWFADEYRDWFIRQTQADKQDIVIPKKLIPIFRRVLRAAKGAWKKLKGKTNPALDALFKEIVTTGREINERYYYTEKEIVTDYIVGSEPTQEQYETQGISVNNKTGMSWDPSSICPKQEAFVNWMMAKIEDGTIKSYEALADVKLLSALYDEARAEGIDVPCDYCYVEQARRKAIAAHQAGRTISSVNFAMAKKVYHHIPYTNAILEMSDAKIETLNRRGGLRLFSFSDYIRTKHRAEVELLLDHAKKRGLSIKAITKNPHFVEDFAKRGIIINITIPEKPKGEFGIPWSQAATMKKKYPNVKTRIVAMNPKALWASLKLQYRGIEEFLDVITPYHHDNPSVPVPDNAVDMGHKSKAGKALIKKAETDPEFAKRVCCLMGGKCFSEIHQKQCASNCGNYAGVLSVPAEIRGLEEEGLTKAQRELLVEHFPDKLAAFESSREDIAFDKKPYDLSKEGLRAWANKQYTRFVMQEYPIVRLAQAAGQKMADKIERQIQRVRGQGGLTEAALHSPQAFRGLKEDGITEYNEITKSLEEILKPLDSKEEYQDYEQLRIEERNVALAIHRPDIKGIDQEKAELAIQFLEDKYGEKIEKFRKVSAEHREFERQAILRPLVNIGWMSKETYENIINRPEYEYYASFLREMEDVDSAVGGGKDPIKRIVGSERKKIPTVEGTIANLQKTIKLVETQRLNKQLAELRNLAPDLAEEIQEKTPLYQIIKGDYGVYKVKKPKKALKVFETEEEAAAYSEITPGTIVIKRPNQTIKLPIQPPGTIVVAENGQKKYYTVPSEVAKAIDYYTPKEVHTAIKIMRIPARFLRAGATLSFEFMARNPVRDQFSAFVYSNYGYNPFTDFYKGMYNLLKKTDLYKEYKAAGGEQSYFVSVDRQSTNLTARNLVGYKKKGKERFATLNPLEALRMFSEWTEKGTRLGLYAKAKEKGATGLEAMAESREGTLDFGRLGTQGKAINQIVAFWNANVQGTDKMARSFKRYPGRTAMRAFLGITLPSIALWFINHDDERYKALPQWQKNFFWVIILEDGPIIRIPKPFELGLVAGSMFERILDFVYENDPEELKSIAEAIKDGALPGVIPTSVLPAIEYWTNYSFFRERKIESLGLQKLPARFRYTPFTTEMMKEAGKLTNISPVMLENWVRGWGGTLTMETLRYMDVFLKDPKVERTKQHWYEVTPGLKGFIAREPIGSAAKHVEVFYNNLKETAEADNGYKLLKESNRADAVRWKAKKQKEIRFAQKAKRTSRILANLRKKINKIILSEEMTAAEKRIRIDDLSKRISDKAQYFNLAYEQDRISDVEGIAFRPEIKPFTPSKAMNLRQAIMKIK